MTRFLELEIPDEAVRAAMEHLPMSPTLFEPMRRALAAGLAVVRFTPCGDSHHNAAECAFCSGHLLAKERA